VSASAPEWQRRYSVEADRLEVILACAQCGPVLSAGRDVALPELISAARWHESHTHDVTNQKIREALQGWPPDVTHNVTGPPLAP